MLFRTARWSQAVQRLPRSVSATLGVVCVVVGAVLTLRPFSSLAVLVLMVAAGLVSTGLVELFSARDSPAPRLAIAAGVGWLAAGVAVLVWPGLTIDAVTAVAGLAMIVGGVVRAVVDFRGTADQRFSAFALGAVSVILGVLALSWPDVTVLVIAVAFGVRTVWFGFTELAAAVKPGDRRREPPTRPERAWRSRLRRWSRAAAATVALVVAVLLLVVSARLHAASPRPGEFYTAPSDVSSSPGVLLRSEPITRGVPAAARSWRILYTTTRDDGTPAVASAVVLAAVGIPAGPRPVIAWAHGTTGITRGCAPSLSAEQFPHGIVPAVDHVIARGWVMVATDYVGLGTEGGHRYLIGQDAARAVLDSVRAVRRLAEVSVSDRTVVWGHSQGGHAALWTGISAAGYAPDVPVLGVAAIAPASDLSRLATILETLKGGSVLAAYVLQAYSDRYPEVSFNHYVRPAARIQFREMASRCLDTPEVYVSAVTAMLFGRDVLRVSPTDGALGRRLEQNTPSGPIAAPLLLAQGESDPLILPSMQADFVRRRCASGGGPLEYRTYPGRDHLSVVAVDSPLNADLVEWTQDRIDGRPATSTCTT